MNISENLSEYNEYYILFLPKSVSLDTTKFYTMDLKCF